MALIKAQANGNSNSAATWFGGIIPGIGDEAFANGFSVAITHDLTCNAIRTEASVLIGAAAGGGFTCTSNRIITTNAYAGTTVCLTISGTAVTTFIGNTYGGSGVGAYGINKTSSGYFTMIGNGYGGTNTIAMGLVCADGDSHITGSGYSGMGNTAVGIEVTSPGITTITGNGYALASGVGMGVRVNGTGTCYLGIAVASTNISASAAVCQSLNGKLIVERLEYSSNGFSPVIGRVFFKNTNASCDVLKENGNRVLLSDSSEVVSQVPAESDVRAGVTYLIGTKTGTLEVPPKEMVALGVPSDDRFGSLNLTVDAEEVANKFFEGLKISNDELAVRIRNVATVQSTAATIENSL